MSDLFVQISLEMYLFLKPNNKHILVLHVTHTSDRKQLFDVTVFLLCYTRQLMFSIGLHINYTS